jgi:hypothetical protein
MLVTAGLELLRQQLETNLNVITMLVLLMLIDMGWTAGM